MYKIIYKQIKECLVFFIISVVTFSTVAQVPVVVERFNKKPSGEWIESKDPKSAGKLEWSAETDGLVFMTPGDSTKAASETISPGNIVRTWEIGTGAFEATWRVELAGGQCMSNRAPAIHVGISSEKPDQMKLNVDYAIQMGVGNAGISAGVYTGPFMVLNQNTKGTPHFGTHWEGKWISGITRSFEGMASVFWFREWLENQTVTLRIRRTINGKLQFTVWHHELGLEKPWWDKVVDVPNEMEHKSLSYLFVMVSPNRSDSPLHSQLSRVKGSLKDLQVKPLATPSPEILSVDPVDGTIRGGSNYRIRGKNFGINPKVLVGAVNSKVLSVTDNEIIAQLPVSKNLVDGISYPLEIHHSCGLIGFYPERVLLGQVVKEIQPREVNPKGGDVVTLIGAGFSKGLNVTINGEKAKVVEYINSNKIRIQIPAGKAGLAKIKVLQDGIEFKGDPVFAYAPHPYIIYKSEELDDLQKKFKEPMFVNYRMLILNGAQKEVDMLRLEESDGFNQAYYFWMAYLMTGDIRPREKLMEMMNAICAQHNHFQFQVQKAVAVATVYDSMFKELSPKERQMMIEYLDRTLNHYLDRTSKEDWWFANNPSNTITVGGNAGGFSALALMYSRPNDAEVAIDTAARLINEIYKGINEDGSCVEGTLYWDYGLTHQVILGNALNNVLGSDYGLLTQKRLEGGVNFAMSQLGGNGVMFVNNDTQPWLTGLALAADFGSRYNQPFMRWLADEIVRLEVLDKEHSERKRVALNTRAQFIVSAFLYRDRVAAPEQMPPLPTLSVMPSIQWATVRSGSMLRGPMVLNVKGHKGLLGHHKQPDKGNFQLHARGEAFIITPGYFSGNPQDLSIPLIDGVGSDKEAMTSAPITNIWEQGIFRGVSVDATEPYAKKTGARRVIRHFVMVGDEALVVLDDILPDIGAKGEITAQWQSQYSSKINQDKRLALITGDNSNLQIETYGPEIILEVEGPRKFGRSWVYRDFEEGGLASWHTIRGKYLANEVRPLVTVFQVIDKLGKIPLINKVDYPNDQVIVTMGNGQTVKFKRSQLGWSVDL